MEDGGLDGLVESLETMRLRTSFRPWHCLGEVWHWGTGWNLRDPSSSAEPPEVMRSSPGPWVLQCRERGTFETGCSLQFMCYWTGMTTPFVWVEQEPIPLETGCLVCWEAAHFRRDSDAETQMMQYRGFHVENDGDVWMLSGLQHLDASPRPAPGLPLRYTSGPHGWWIDTEPVILHWEVSYSPDGTVSALRWSLPIATSD